MEKNPACHIFGGTNMAEDMLFSGESKNIEYKVTVPDKIGRAHV